MTDAPGPYRCNFPECPALADYQLDAGPPPLYHRTRYACQRHVGDMLFEAPHTTVTRLPLWSPDRPPPHGRASRGREA